MADSFRSLTRTLVITTAAIAAFACSNDSTSSSSRGIVGHVTISDGDARIPSENLVGSHRSAPLAALASRRGKESARINVIFRPDALGAARLGAMSVRTTASAREVGTSIRARLAAHPSASLFTVTDVSPVIGAARLRVHDPSQRDAVMAALYRAELVTAYAAGWIGNHAEPFARRPKLRKALLRMVMAHPDLLPAPLVSEQVRGTGKPGFLPALDALTSYPIRDRLSEIAAPTLIVWGADDALVPRRDADVFEELISDSRKVVFDDTGHVAMLERPQRFNRLLIDFLAEKPGEEVDETSEAAIG